MGYEIIFSYFDEIEGSDGEYNRDEIKTMKKRIGDPYEDVNIDRCAGAILAQLARRDIWVKDVEVFEVSKKKIAYKASKGSVLLKNKKYRMDGSAEIISQEIQEAPPAPQQQALVLANGQQVATPISGAHPHNRGVLKPIKWVMFQPSYNAEDDMIKAKLKLLRFTVDKKYPVFAEQLQANQVGMAYRTIDDLGREQLVSDEYFVPADSNLLMDRELGFSQNAEKRDGGLLQWGGAVREDNMPKLR
jgi:hypothetical protein